MGRSLVRTSSTVYAGCMCDFNKTNPIADLPTQFHPQGMRPRPHAVQRVGHNIDPEEAFNLR